MKKLPKASMLANAILATPTGKNQTLAMSMQYLLSKSAALKQYRGVEHLISAEDPHEKLRRAAEHHLVALRSRIARELWGRQLFIGVSVLDDLLFHAVVEGSANPVLRTLEAIRDHGLHHPGLVVYPIHSFGILGAGWLRFFARGHTEFASRDFGLVLAPQTNSLERTIELLERARVTLGVKKRIPVELIEHWHRSRTASWLTRNPLLIIKVQSFPGHYYENQFLLVGKLREATTLVSMLATLQRADDEDTSRFSSSSMVNNFQTLDFKHYMVLFSDPSARDKLSGDFVPMHLRGPALAELSDLGIELDPRQWARRSKDAHRIHRALSAVHAGYLRYGFGPEKESLLGRVYRKLFEATVFFRRSFHRSDMDWSAIISLVVAFEMLLTDGFAPNVKTRVVRRTRRLLRGVQGMRRYTRAVDDLCSARGAIVHTGTTRQKVDLRDAQRAFVHAFVVITERLPTLPATSTAPMRDLSGDLEH